MRSDTVKLGDARAPHRSLLRATGVIRSLVAASVFAVFSVSTASGVSGTR